MGLTFEQLRSANLARVTEFRDARGRLSHPNGVDDWDASRWMMALTGEVGELANYLKKVERGDFSLDDARWRISLEIADIVTYLDLLSARLDISMGDAVREKFNLVSERVNSSVKLD